MTEFLDTFILPLEREGIPYVVTGSVAAMAYGEPRLTNDIDLVIEITEPAVAALARAFPESDYYLPPAEVIHAERVRSLRGHFNVIHLDSMLKADLYLAGEDPLHRFALSRPLALEIEGRIVKFAPIEYVIVRKLEFFREGLSEKHLRDIASMLIESGDEIDQTLLDEEIVSRGLGSAWEHARSLAEG